LINKSFKIAKEKGYKSIFLVGDPAYYNRFGFKASVNFGIKNNLNIPDEYVLACELVPGSLSGISAMINLNNF